MHFWEHINEAMLQCEENAQQISLSVSVCLSLYIRTKFTEINICMFGECEAMLKSNFMRMHNILVTLYTYIYI